MKRLLVILFLFFYHLGFAQHNTQLSIVYLHDGSMIKGQVVEDHAAGLVYITIMDGTEISIPLKSVKTINNLKDNIEFVKGGKYVQSKGVYKMISIGTLTAWEDDEKDFIVWGASLFHFNMGYQFNQFLSVGGGFGMDIYEKEYLPIYADFRGYILNSKVSPYYAIQAGYGISSDIFNNYSRNISHSGGAMIHPTIGLRFSSYRSTKFLLEAGYKFQYDNRTNERNNTVDKLIYKRLSLKIGVLF